MSNALMMDDHMGPPETALAPEPSTVLEEPAKPKTLSNEHRLQAENLALQIQLTVAQKNQFIAEANQKVSAYDDKLRGLQQSVSEYQTYLSTVYDVDFTKEQIEASTGRIRPVRPNEG